MKIRVKAPLRLGFGGGGTDVEPYCSDYGGAVFNTTIDLFAYCLLDSDAEKDLIIFESMDLGVVTTYSAGKSIPLDGKLDLYKHIYNAFLKISPKLSKKSIHIKTYSEVPSGSGLGGSSTLVVAIAKGFVDLLGLPWGDYELARFSYHIERVEAGIIGGHQDQYAACFGGFNYMEFYGNERVLVNPLRIRNWVKAEFEASLILYFTGITRSASIIEEEKKNAIEKNKLALDAMHQSKKDSLLMKEFILKGEVKKFADCLERSWQAKKRMAKGVTNKAVDEIYLGAINAGALAGKVSGAGGGGFMFFVCPPEKKFNVIKFLQNAGGQIYNFHFYNDGVTSWKQ